MPRIQRGWCGLSETYARRVHMPRDGGGIDACRQPRVDLMIPVELSLVQGDLIINLVHSHNSSAESDANVASSRFSRGKYCSAPQIDVPSKRQLFQGLLIRRHRQVLDVLRGSCG